MVAPVPPLASKNLLGDAVCWLVGLALKDPAPISSLFLLLNSSAYIDLPGAKFPFRTAADVLV